ncbi:MAG TPA: tRNA 2-thiouridine(34) synthase MnmA, partial [Parachlamydiales bacterium]|nr:tRNA 2-thiouridine(34) synthase MnmA [Parachlamydiales bacterium]
HAVSGKALEKVLFPVGHLTKREVRALSREHGLATSEKKDSTGACFIGKRDFKPFLAQYVEMKRGLFKTFDGKIVGEHDGMAFYTLGQRRGMGLGGEGDAWYVVGKDRENNVVFVERGDHPALYADALTARDPCWVRKDPEEFPYKCSAKIRYRQTDQACTIESKEGDLLQVRFDQPQRAAAPGQSIVFYEGDECLGGAVIQSVGPSYFEQKKELRR